MDNLYRSSSGESEVHRNDLDLRVSNDAELVLERQSKKCRLSHSRLKLEFIFLACTSEWSFSVMRFHSLVGL